MSAKWRRYKKRSKRFHISRDHKRVSNGKTPRRHPIKNTRVKRATYPCQFNLVKIFRDRKLTKREPLIDIFEERNKIIVVAEFAGFKRENLEIHLKDQRLVLSAEASDRRYYTSLGLPTRVILGNVCTSCKNGVLKIQLEKALEEEPIDKVGG